MNQDIKTIDDLLKENGLLKWELEIESALEKVRTIALGMKEPADMPEVCKVIALQLDKLGVKKIRNVQTAIFYESKVVYMNYEYYAKHDKTIITETSYTDHKIHQAFADQMLKGKGEFYSTHIAAGELKDWIAYQKTTNVFIDTYLEKASSLNYYWHSLGPVALGISTYIPLNEEELSLFKRFLNVFELAYTRYLDIEQALAQAKEAQIEAALERVRSRTMAMHNSEELLDIIIVVSEQLQQLGIQFANVSFGVNNQNYDMQLWMAVKGYSQAYHIHWTYLDNPGVTRLKAARERPEHVYSDVLTHTENNEWLQHIIYCNPSLDIFSEETRKSLLNTPGFARSIVIMKDIFLVMGNYAAIPYTDEVNAILKRFANVFEQAYKRFLDLQKAEAQTREARIEAALERTRNHSMLMQHSDELDITSRVFHEQLLLLGIESEFSFVWLPDVGKEKHLFWTTWAVKENDSNVLQSKSVTYDLDRTEPYTAECFKAWESGEPVHIYSVAPAEVKSYFDTWGGLLSGAEKLKPEFFPEGLYYAEAFMKYGCFGVFIRRLLREDEKKILLRFTIEFERTYTRFLDLKKAEEQSIESELEKKRSEDLLLNILPREIANELKQFGKSYARKHEQVSILFSDIKGFSTISETLSAEELVTQLDECFRAFDHIVGKHGLEKIKTIGDAYICACGLPNPDPDNAVKTVRAAIDMLDFAKGFGMTKIIQGLPAFEFRVGIHTGPVITGVVGLKKFTYDIWGDAVNMAARMEQHGEAGKINVSGNTYRLIKDKFICTHRGKIPAKNKGEVDMYFVEKANN